MLEKDIVNSVNARPLSHLVSKHLDFGHFGMRQDEESCRMGNAVDSHNHPEIGMGNGLGRWILLEESRHESV